MKDYIVFSISSNKKLAKDFAKFWNCQLGKVEVSKFADGEMLVKVISDVKDKDVILIESTAKKPNDHVVQILMMLDAVNRMEAKSVTLIIPYFGYSRQERISEPGQSLSSEVIAKMIETGKYNRLLTFDLHQPVIETFFKRGIVNLPTTEVFGAYFDTYLKENKISTKDIMVVSPDHGSNSRADRLMFRLRGSKRAILDKVRTGKDQIEHLELNEDVEGKICILIDDIISTGNTIASAAKLLHKKKAKAIIVGATHGVFSKDAVEKIKKAGVKDIITTNTIEQDIPEGVKCLDILQLIIENI